MGRWKFLFQRVAEYAYVPHKYDIEVVCLEVTLCHFFRLLFSHGADSRGIYVIVVRR